MSVHMAGTASTPSWTDLRELAIANHRRRRFQRWSFIAFGASMVTLLLGGTVWIYATANSPQPASVTYFYFTVAAIGSALAVMMVSGAIRILFMPPFALSVGPDGPTFRFANGKSVATDWKGPFQCMFVYLMPATPEMPCDACCCLRVRRGRVDEFLPWRRMIPLVFMPSESASSLVRSATEAGMSISSQELTQPDVFIKSMPRTCLTITST
jgi:hypothetical protein